MSKKELFCHYLVKNFLKEYMKYTTKEALKEIKRRAKVIRQKRDKRITNILATSVTLSLIALFAVIGEVSSSEVSGMQNAYGSFILSAKTGGYILVAVLGFVAGVSITLMVKYLKKK